MKRALFVAFATSPHLQLLKIFREEEDAWFDSKTSSDFKDIVFYGADVIPEDGKDDTYLLDSTGEILKNLGHNMYLSSVLGQPELPVEIRDITSKTKKDENITA